MLIDVNLKVDIVKSTNKSVFRNILNLLMRFGILELQNQVTQIDVIV